MGFDPAMKTTLPRISQSPTDPGFVQSPYPFYERARALGPLVWWDEYGAPITTTREATMAVLKDRRLGRERDMGEIPERLQPFYDVEAHSMLELDPPRHTRLRALVLRAFTSRAIADLAPDIETLCHDLIDAFPDEPFDLIAAYAQQVPVLTIARLLGVSEDRAPDLLRWSNDMVAMYQAGRTRADEDRAITATTEISDYVRAQIAHRRDHPGDDLISTLIAARDEGDRLSEDELISTMILLLNAGHEATVHALGNAARTALTLSQYDTSDTAIEEHLRYAPPLHLFSRWSREDITLFGHDIPTGQRIDCLLAAANHDPDAYPDPQRFDPDRKAQANASFGGGLHFCVGAPLARLEMQIALRILFERCPTLALMPGAAVADIYHFHGHRELMVRR